MTILLKAKRLSADARLPQYATAGAACFDVCSSVGPFEILPGRSASVSTGLAFEIPSGHVMLVYSRSGHGFKNGVRLGNCVGVIDADYRGELKVKLHNDGQDAFAVRIGDRIAQAMIVPVPAVTIQEVEELGETERGAGGFGSTGVAG